ncbi:MAG: hypothetical protein JSV64_04755 [Candidatus Bathyarchaeota archaeon]|nr:MAG: hypothetical protein JSV64_04755 [Candidatus Bathyarchaeota archaeon]
MRGADVGVVLWLLFLVYVVGWFGAFLAFVDNETLINRLEADPQRYLDYVEQTMIFLAVPSIIEIAAIVITNLSSRRFWVEVRSRRSVLAGYGILFLLFSSFGFLRTISSYDVLTEELGASMGHLQNLLLAIHASVAAGFSLWTLAGLLFLVTVLRRKRRRLTGVPG